MSSYKKVSVSAKFSDVSSFSPSRDFAPDDYNPGSGTYRHEVRDVLAATGGTTIDLGMYTTVTQIIVKNKDTANYVEGTFRTTGGGSNNQVLRADAGGFFASGTAVTVANDLVLTANTAAVACELVIIGT